MFCLNQEYPKTDATPPLNKRGSCFCALAPKAYFANTPGKKTVPNALWTVNQQGEGRGAVLPFPEVSGR